MHDIGHLKVNGVHYEVVDVQKVGKAVLHFLDKPLPESCESQTVSGEVNKERRDQLRQHHTATHVMFAACRNVLGPHIWQAGAKKTTEQAHLDITHYSNLTKEQELQIENYANSLVLQNLPIKKYFVDKAVAEKQFGFSLY